MVDVAKRNMSKLKRYGFVVDVDDFVSVLDYLNSVDSVFDEGRVTEVYDSHKDIFSDDLSDYYSNRCRHHIDCIMDGLVKTRCLFEGDDSFVASDEDYEGLREVWGYLVSGWTGFDNLKSLSPEQRLGSLPSCAQYLYKQICEYKGKYDSYELKLAVNGLGS